MLQFVADCYRVGPTTPPSKCNLGFNLCFNPNMYTELAVLWCVVSCVLPHLMSSQVATIQPKLTIEIEIALDTH